MFWLFAALYAAMLPAILLSAFGIGLPGAPGRPAAEVSSPAAPARPQDADPTGPGYRFVVLPQ